MMASYEHGNEICGLSSRAVIMKISVFCDERLRSPVDRYYCQLHHQG
jgi:hypothetical protein